MGAQGGERGFGAGPAPRAAPSAPLTSAGRRGAVVAGQPNLLDPALRQLHGHGGQRGGGCSKRERLDTRQRLLRSGSDSLSWLAGKAMRRSAPAPLYVAAGGPPSAAQPSPAGAGRGSTPRARRRAAPGGRGRTCSRLRAADKGAAPRRAAPGGAGPGVRAFPACARACSVASQSAAFREQWAPLCSAPQCGPPLSPAQPRLCGAHGSSPPPSKHGDASTSPVPPAPSEHRLQLGG